MKCFAKELVFLLISVVLCLITLSVKVNGELPVNNVPELWRNQLLNLRKEIHQCAKVDNHSTWTCFKSRSLRLFKSLMSREVIPIWNGISFVQFTNESITKRMDSNEDEGYDRKDYQYLTWFDRLGMSFVRTLKTHQLRINLKELTDDYMAREDNRQAVNSRNPLLGLGVAGKTNDPVGTARLRRHRYNMMITMMFGATALGAILIPMGFQMLSIVSGKALLMAKMALLLASINGLKRVWPAQQLSYTHALNKDSQFFDPTTVHFSQVANSGVHYGLYHVPGHEHYGGGAYYDRGDVHHPRTVPGVAITQPIDVGIRK